MKFLLSFLMSFLFATTSAQLSGQQFIDSLVNEIPKIENDTARARIYKKIAELYSNSNPAEAMRYAETGMKHVMVMKWNKGIAVYYNLIGNLYNDKGAYEKAIELFQKAYLIHTSIKDTNNAASTLNNIGTTYLRQSVFDKAAVNYFEALKLAESVNNKSLMATCLSNVAAVYFNQSDYSKALEYQFKSLAIQKGEMNKDGLGDNYSAIGNVYLKTKDTLNAKKYYTNALSFYKQTENNIGIATVYTNLSNLFPDYAINLDYKLKAQKFWDVANPAHTLSITNLGNIALVYLNISRYDTLNLVKPSLIVPESKNALLQKVESCLNHASLLANESGDIANIAFITGIRSELNAEKGDFKKAYYDLSSYHEIYDSIYSQEYKNNIASIEGRREVTIRDKQIELDNLALSAQRKQQIGLIAGIGLLLTIGLLLFRQNRLRKNTNITLIKLNNELDEANKVKAKFFAILSHDFRSPLANLIDFLRLQQEDPNLFTAQSADIHRKNITTAAETLLENMETMLLWSKEQMEHFKPQLKVVSVDMLFEYLNHTFSTTQKIGYAFLNAEKIELYSDENYLKTILYNLTSNAVATLKNQADGFITWKAWKEGAGIFLSITDNGIGFPLELISNWNAKSVSINGRNGLGMHIVNDMAKAIDCKVLLSNTNTGACVTMQLKNEY